MRLLKTIISIVLFVGMFFYVQSEEKKLLEREKVYAQPEINVSDTCISDSLLEVRKQHDALNPR